MYCERLFNILFERLERRAATIKFLFQDIEQIGVGNVDIADVRGISTRAGVGLLHGIHVA